MQLNNDLASKNYLIVCDKVDNLGDLSAGFKVIHDLHERIGVPLNNIFVVSNDVESCEIFNKYNIKVEKSKHKIIKKIISEANINLQIATSTDQHTAKNKLTGQVPVLALCEYDFEIDTRTNLFECKSLGLGKEAIGIMIDPSLKEWGFSEDAKDRTKRHAQINELNPQLQQAILGKKNIQKFDETSRLYTSYAREFILAAYLKKIISEDFENKNFVFVLSDMSADSLNDLNLEEFDIDSVKLIPLDKEKSDIKKIELRSKEERKGRKVKIITGRVKHDEMLKLFKAANPKAIVTGDQSLSEAISANMNIIYAAPDHKHKLESNLSRLGYPTFSYEGNRKQNIYLPRFTREDKVASMNQQVCTNYDYLPKFKEILNKIFVTPFEISESLEEISDDKSLFNAVQMNKRYIVSLDQLCKFQIQVATSKSLLSQFADSIFDCISLGNQRYFIMRKQKT